MIKNKIKRLLGFGPKVGDKIRHKGKEFTLARLHKPAHGVMLADFEREMTPEDEKAWQTAIAPSGGVLKPRISIQRYRELLAGAGNNKEAKLLIAQQHWVSDTPRKMTTTCAVDELRKLPDGRWELPG